jgi:hypothetical protein
MSIIHSGSRAFFYLKFNQMQKRATAIALFAIKNGHFALAQKGAPRHIETAFQASSPKTSTARSATTGPFFGPGSRCPPRRPFAIATGSS